MLQVSCCFMERGRRGYVKSSPLYDVSLNKKDTYSSVIRKVCETLVEDFSEEMRLFNLKGAVIPNQCLTIQAKSVEWTLGAFLLKQHTSADKVSFGIGTIAEDIQPVRSKKAKGS